MKKIFLIIFLLCSISVINAQEEDSVKTKKYIQKIDVIFPGVGGEFSLDKDKNFTLSYCIGIKKKSMFLMDRIYGLSNPFHEYYFCTLEARNYVNIKDRVLKNRRVDKFSGAYGSLKLEVGTVCNRGIDNAPYYIEFGPMIGFQRAIGKIWYWDVNAGVGPSLNNDFFLFSFFSSIKFGISF